MSSSPIYRVLDQFDLDDDIDVPSAPAACWPRFGPCLIRVNGKGCVMNNARPDGPAGTRLRDQKIVIYGAGTAPPVRVTPHGSPVGIERALHRMGGNGLSPSCSFRDRANPAGPVTATVSLHGLRVAVRRATDAHLLDNQQMEAIRMLTNHESPSATPWPG
jgi:hypothetical protein